MSVSERNADDGGGGKAAAVAMYALPLLAFLILKGYARAPVSGDEHIYMYAGLRVAEGLVPYREIFLAHPPLHLLIAVIWMLPGFYPPFWVKSAAIAPAAATLLILVFLLRRSGLSRPTVFLAGMLMALSMDFLTVSTHFTGANWSMLWLIVGTGALAMNRPIIGAAALAVSGLTSFHVLPAAGGALFLEVLRSRKKAIRTLLVFAGVTLGVHLACLGLFGKAYLMQVFGYHLAKTEMSGSGAASIIRFFHNEYHLATLALFGAGFLLFSSVKGMKRAAGDRGIDGVAAPLFALASSAAIFQIAALFLTGRVFTYYLAPLLPLFVIAAALFIDVSLRYAIRFAASWKKDGKAPKKGIAVIASISVALALCFILGERLESRLGYYKRAYASVSDYTWRDSPVLPLFMNSLIKRSFFDPERRVGDVDCGVKRYLWHEIASEDPSVLLPELEKRAGEPGRLFGDASTAPYFALSTGRKITLEQADTNAQIFKSGMIRMSELIDDLDREAPAFVIINPRRGIGSHPAFKDYLKANYQPVARAKSAKKKTLILYELKH